MFSCKSKRLACSSHEWKTLAPNWGLLQPNKSTGKLEAFIKFSVINSIREPKPISMNDVNADIYTFINKLRPYIELNLKRKKVDMIGAVPKPIITLDNVINLQMHNIDPDTGLKVNFYKDVNGKQIGLDISDYKDFSFLISQLLKEPFWNSNCDLEYLCEKSFDWLIDVYKTNKAETNLTTYLTNEILNDINEYHFFLKVNFLAIESPLKIGNVLITKYTEEEIQSYYKEYSEVDPITFDMFNELFGDIFDSIVAHVKVKALTNRAETIALKEVELAIDVLKCFSAPFCIDDYQKIFDVDYRINTPNSANYLVLRSGDFKKPQLRLTNTKRLKPTEITNDFIEKSWKHGMKTYSDFIADFSEMILNNKSNELYNSIIELVKQLSDIVSTDDIHLKVVKSITLLEGFLIPNRNGKGRGQSIVKSIIPFINNNPSYVESTTKCINVNYAIRDKYLHNYIKLTVSKSELIKLIAFEIEFIENLMHLNKTMKTVDEVLVHMGIIKADLTEGL